MQDMHCVNVDTGIPLLKYWHHCALIDNPPYAMCDGHCRRCTMEKEWARYAATDTPPSNARSHNPRSMTFENARKQKANSRHSLVRGTFVFLRDVRRMMETTSRRQTTHNGHKAAHDGHNPARVAIKRCVLSLFVPIFLYIH
jgi:hypothetical protein